MIFSKNPLSDLWIFIKAAISNLVAILSPCTYVRLTHQTGRGNKVESPEEVAGYFLDCFNDYLHQLGVTEDRCESFLANKKILEYGPGDTMGVALLLYAHGAQSIKCIDRFPLSNDTERSSVIYECLLRSLEGESLRRAAKAFIEEGNPKSGFKPDRISYSIRNDGLSGEIKEYDLVLSRAVLEHVNDLESTIDDICNCLKVGGISVHQIDLKSHGLDRRCDYDFLSWPVILYELMYSHKGFPNRWRVDKYLQLLQKSKIMLKAITPTGKLENRHILDIKEHLAKPFRYLPTEQLSWTGFWLVLERKE